MNFRLACFSCLLTSLFAINASGTDSCTPIPNLAKNLGRVFNQHCTSWCSIYVTADLITQKMQKLGKLKASERIQPLSVAGSLFFKLGGDASSVGARNRDFEGPYQVVHNLSQNKLCSEDEIGSDTSLQNDLFRISEAKTAALFTAANNCSDPSQINRLNAQIHRISEASWQSLLKTKCTIEIPAVQVDNVFDKNRYEVLAKSNAPDDPRVATKMGSAIDASLNRGSVPAILLDIDSFIDPKQNVISDECGGMNGNGMHWASIISRRLNAAGICEYQVRSSWGSSCEGFYNPPDCKDGTFWISREKLLEKVANVQSVR